VDSKDGEKLSKEMDCAWTETSAKENINISECALVFLGAVFLTSVHSLQAKSLNYVCKKSRGIQHPIRKNRPPNPAPCSRCDIFEKS
jgi:hypothetical protein